MGILHQGREVTLARHGGVALGLAHPLVHQLAGGAGQDGSLALGAEAGGEQQHDAIALAEIDGYGCGSLAFFHMDNGNKAVYGRQ